MDKLRKIRYYLWVFKYPILMLLMGFALCLWGCGPVKYVPTDTVEKIEYRDSIVYFSDTIEVPVPVEKIIEVIPDVDTSYLETSVAKSTAYLEKSSKKLHHTLEQKGTVKTKIDTVIKIEYVNKYIDREIPVEVEIVKYKRDNIFYISIIFNILIIISLFFKFYYRNI